MYTGNRLVESSMDLFLVVKTEKKQRTPVDQVELKFNMQML